MTEVPRSGGPGRVIVVGSVNVDLVVRTARLPHPGETVSGGQFARHHGGKGGNQAVAASRLGARAVIVGAIGDDDLATDGRAGLEAEGVDTEHLASVPGVATGVALIVVDGRGENLIAVAPGANGTLTPDMVERAIERLEPGPGDVILAGHEVPTAAIREALRLGRAAGATTVFNPAPADGLDRTVLGLVDVLTPNRGELEQLVSEEARRTGRAGRAPTMPALAAAALLGATSEGGGPRAVLVSMGPGGALLVRPGHPPLEVTAPRVDAVDATGAGDALNGALAAGLAAGQELEVAVHRAVLAATRSTLRAGAREGLVTAAELERLASGLGSP